MKKILFSLVLINVCFSSLAQYKKDAVFHKDGKITVGGGATVYIMGNGKQAAKGLFFSASKESDRGKVFKWFNLTLIAPYTYSYVTTAYPTNSSTSTKENVTVTGKSAPTLVYDFNLGIFLFRSALENSMSRPYVSFGFNAAVALSLGSYNKQPDPPPGYNDVDREVDPLAYSPGLRVGLGNIFNVSKAFSLKLDAGYTYQLNIASFETKDYSLFTSHLGVSVGARFKIGANK